MRFYFREMSVGPQSEMCAFSPSPRVPIPRTLGGYLDVPQKFSRLAHHAADVFQCVLQPDPVDQSRLGRQDGFYPNDLCQVSR